MALNPGTRLGPYEILAVSPDGQRFLIPRLVSGASEEPAAPPVIVVMNWPVGLRR
jgi:hypothetical protein